MWTVESFVFADSEGSEEGRENVRSMPRVTRKGALTSNTIFGFSACVLCTRWSVEFFKCDLDMASLNKGSFQKDILDDEINIIALSVEQNDLRPCMSELINTAMMDLIQTSTKIPQIMINVPWPITKMAGLHW